MMERILQQRYRVVRALGRGGLGAVFLCDDLRLPGRQWAVKQMHNPEPTLYEKFRESFEREAATLSRIRHPNLPVIVDYFEQDESLYLVMEYVEGENLAEYVRRTGHLSEREAFERGLILVELLGYLHAQDPPIIFRDLKPENVMITPAGVLKLVDFGLARRFVPGKRSDTVPSGSVGYAAPEQWEDLSQTDERSDIYSWGATMVHLLTGRIPSPVFPLSALRGLDTPVSEPGRAILTRCLKARVQERYANCNALARAIHDHLEMLRVWDDAAKSPRDADAEGAEEGAPAEVPADDGEGGQPTPSPRAPVVPLSSASPPPPPRRAPGDSKRAGAREKSTSSVSIRGSVQRWRRTHGASYSMLGPLLLMILATLSWFQAVAVALPGPPPPPPTASPTQPLYASRPELSSGVSPYQLHYNYNEKTDRARKLYEKGEWAEAIGLLDQATTQHPEDAEAHILNQNAYIHLSRLPSVTIPYIGSMTGADSAEFSSQLHGLALAQATVNARGGIHGKKVIVDLYDDESSLARCLQLAEELVKDPKTLVIIGPYNSQRTIAVAPIVNAAHANLVAATASAEKVWQSGPYVFSAADSTDRRVRALARHVLRSGVHKVAVLSDETSRISQEMAQTFEDELRRGGGVTIVKLPTYTEDTTSFESQFNTLRKERPDFIFMCEYRAIQTARFAKALREQGFATTLGAQTIPFTRELIDLGGKAVDGLLVSAFFHPQMDTPRVRAFVASFHRKFGNLTPTHLSECTFDAFDAVCEVLERESTREGINKRLRAAGVTAPPFAGIVGPFAMSRHLDARPVWIIEVKDGRYRLVGQATEDRPAPSGSPRGMTPTATALPAGGPTGRAPAATAPPAGSPTTAPR